jgi:hypothetical protein
MLADFFKQNGQPTTIATQTDLVAQLGISQHLTNLHYSAGILQTPPTSGRLKIEDKQFSNFSFNHTKFQKVYFFNCKFEDCLFVGAEFDSCEFHNCSFINCNTHKIIIRNTYIDPTSFVDCISRYQHANIAVHLFQQLLRNADDTHQAKFSRIAEYNFKKWEDRLNIYRLRKKKPTPISFWKFLTLYPHRWLYRYTFGYGLRLKNFLLTFVLTFIMFAFVNWHNWESYKMQKKDVQICAFDSTSVNVTADVLYTLDATTKLVDSQMQPTSNKGMGWLSLQGAFGFLLLSGLITIIANRYVK